MPPRTSIRLVSNTDQVVRELLNNRCSICCLEGGDVDSDDDSLLGLDHHSSIGLKGLVRSSSRNDR